MAGVLLFIAGALAMVVVSIGQMCGPNQYYDPAGPRCPDYCGKPKVAPCTGISPGCFCNPGYILDGSLTICIPETQCIPTFCTGSNQMYTVCGTYCPKYCGMPDPEPACIGICVEGCYCQPGFIFLTEALGICIPESHC